MNKLILLICLFTLSAQAQDSMVKELDSIVDIDLAKEYIASKKSKSNKLITFNEEKHKTILAKDLFGLPKGRIKTIQSEFGKVYYKIIEKQEVLHYRVSYIFIDGEKLSLTEIYSLRNQIRSKYNDGAPFSQLARRNSMDQNAQRGGDLGWFKRGETATEFEAKAIDGDYNVGDVYTIDVPNRNWYYLVLKTYEPKNIKEIKVLKIAESKK